MTESTRSQRGWSLVKGPVAIIGVLGIAFGVAGLIFGGHHFTTASIPHGTETGKLWLGVSANGWTNLLFIAAGLLLLLGSSMHWGAKTSAFVVAGVLGAAAVIAVIRGNGVFGIFAANHRTEIVWGAAAIVLVLLSMLPRVGGKSGAARAPAEREPVAREPVTRETSEPVGAPRDPAGRDGRLRRVPVAQDELVVPRDRTVNDESAADDETIVQQPHAGDE